MQVVVETPGYLKKAELLFDEDARERIVATVSENPLIGDLIPHCGGFRKFRVPALGKGKRGGARIIYYYRNEQFPVFLVQVYAKNEKNDLTRAECRELAKFADSIFRSYGR